MNRFFAIAKQLAGICVSLVLATTLVSCGNSGDALRVRELVNQTLEGLKTPTQASIENSPDSKTLLRITEYGIDPITYMDYCFKNLSWEISDVKVDGSKADCELTISNISLDDALNAAADSFAVFSETDEAQALFEEEGESGIFAKLFELLYQQIDSGTMPVQSQTVTVHCEKDQEDTWHISNTGNQEYLSALYGGSDVSALL